MGKADEEMMEQEAFIFSNSEGIFFTDEVFTYSVNRFIKLFCEKLDKEKIPEMSEKIDYMLPFKVIFNCPGGSVSDGLACYDMINYLLNSKTKNVSYKLTTVATGIAASMGGILFLLGEKRLVTKNAQIMLHSLTGGTYGKYKDAKNQLKQLDIMMNQLVDIIETKTKLPYDKVVELLETDSFLSAEECVEMGIAHDVI